MARRRKLYQDFLRDIIDSATKVRAPFSEEFGGPIPCDVCCGTGFRQALKKQVRHRPKIATTETVFGMQLIVSDQVPRDVAYIRDHHGNVLQTIVLKERSDD